MISAALLVAMGIAAISPLRDYQRAASLLLRMEDAEGSGGFARLGTYPVDESITRVLTSDGPVHARLFVPRGKESPPGLVLLHGVHYLGIDEPRLVKFAHAFAQSGVTVLTPQLDDLAAYQIMPRSIDVIGASAHLLRQRTGKTVGVMGLSFAGGLALLAAADHRYSPDISMIVAVGAHDSLYRVAKFLVTGVAQSPNGRVATLQPEQYGALVLVYEHPAEFFSANDVPAARECLRLWLAEKYDAARLGEAGLSANDKSVVEALFRYNMKALRQQLLAEIEHDRADFDAVSPQGRLTDLHVPVFLLHGASDAVIPSTETQWLAHEIPAATPEVVLITPAMGHVDPNLHLGIRQRWQLINFMAKVFERLGAESSSR